MQKYTMLDELYSYNTRTKHKRNYFVTRISTKQAQKYLIYIGPKIWNQIPLQVKEMNFYRFKKEFKRILIDTYQ